MLVRKFGYRIQNGECVIDRGEADIIKEIVNKYLSGESLKTIAEFLTAKKAEYSPGKSLWNKNRIHRILTDAAYTGNSEYLQIVSSSDFENVRNLMYNRNTQKHCDRTSIFSSSIVPVLCGKCGQTVSRRHDIRCKIPVHYLCTNPECKISYHISDDELQTYIKSLLTDVKEEPPKLSDEKILELKRLNNEIERDLQGTNIDSDALKSKIFECAALQYSALYLKPKESMDLTDINPCSQIFIQELKRKVSAVILDGNQKIRLRLVNGKEIDGVEK